MKTQSYTGTRVDVQRLVSPEFSCILDVGCSDGSLGGELKNRSPSVRVFGIEYDENFVRLAESKLDQVKQADLNKDLISEIYPNSRFDVLIFADVLEHLVEPWDSLKDAVKLLQPHGEVIISIPNVGHITTICNILLRGHWPYRERGIHDKTHMRWFANKNVEELCGFAGLRIVSIDRKMRLLDAPSKLNRLAVLFKWVPWLRNVFTYQYILVAKLESAN